MRTPILRRLTLSTLTVLLILVATYASAQADPAVPNAKQAALEQEYQQKVRELARLRDEIDRLLKDLDRTPESPFVEEPARPASVPALSLEQVTSASGGSVWNVVSGWEFAVNGPAIEVTDLGVFDSDKKGLDVEFPVGIWDNSGKLIVSAQVPAGDKARLVDQFRYVNIKPTRLESGRRYVIAALYTTKTKEMSVSGGSNFYTVAPVRWLNGKRAKSEELAFPDAAAEKFAAGLGSFGPNFLVSPGAATQAARHYYRLRRVPQPPKLEAVVVPEKPDGSHKEEKIVTVGVFASPDGKLTQIVAGETPLGAGEQAFPKLVDEMKRIRQSTRDYAPIYRVAAMPQVRYRDLQTIVSIVDHGHYHPRGNWPIISGVETTSLYDARLPLPQKDGQLITPERFRDAGEYIEDRWTGLLWQKDGTASGKKNFNEARDYAAGLELEGLKDWRVPTIDELATIFPATFEPFKNTKYTPNQCCSGPDEFASYWTSELDSSRPDYAFVYQWYAKGGANNCTASKNYAYVRCVHDLIKEDRPAE